MDFLPKNELLEYHSDTLKEVRKLYRLDKPGAMEEAIDILDKWIRTQNHFTKKDFDREYLERKILTAKGSVEKAKAKLDKLFTLRNLMPKFFMEYEPNYFESIMDKIIYVMLPKLTDVHNRIYYHKVAGKNFTSKMFLDGYRFSILLSEYTSLHDYAKSYYVIVDYLDVAIGDLLKTADLLDLRQAFIAEIEGYGVRVESIHILVNSKLVDSVISIVKQMVSKKMGKRIYCHKSYEDMFKHIPYKSIFPKECGGEEKSLKEIQADWMKVLDSEKFRQYWKLMLSARTDESLRQTDTFNEQYMGMPGTFRTLKVD